MAKHDPMHRSRRLLSPAQKWEIFLEVTAGELTQADAARKWDVDAGTVVRVRRDAKDACLSAFASWKPGRPWKARDDELEPGGGSSPGHVNTLLVQRVLSEPAWKERLTEEDRRGLTALFWSNLRPYGLFELDMDRHLDFDLAATA
jgi:hypothetical protein